MFFLTYASRSKSGGIASERSSVADCLVWHDKAVKARPKTAASSSSASSTSQPQSQQLEQIEAPPKTD